MRLTKSFEVLAYQRSLYPMVRRLSCTGGSVRSRRNIALSNNEPNRTAHGRIELKQASVRSRGASRELRYVLAHPSGCGIIVANGSQLFDDSQPTRYLHCKGECQARPSKARRPMSRSMLSSDGSNMFGIWILLYSSRKMLRSWEGGLVLPMMWEVP